MAVPSNRFLGVLSVLIGLAVATAAAVGTKPLVNTGESGDLAIKGYDVVAYFGAGVPTKGDPRFVHRWNDRYLAIRDGQEPQPVCARSGEVRPQFGGYCCLGHQPRLHRCTSIRRPSGSSMESCLIYSKSVELRWEQDIPGNIIRAETNWPAVLQK